MQDAQPARMSHRKLASEMGWKSPSTVTQYLNGDIHPNLETIERLCIVLNCTEDKLREGLIPVITSRRLRELHSEPTKRFSRRREKTSLSACV